MAEVPAKNLAFSYILNSPGAISFTLPYFHPTATMDLLAEGQRELIIFREGIEAGVRLGA